MSWIVLVAVALAAPKKAPKAPKTPPPAPCQAQLDALAAAAPAAAGKAFTDLAACDAALAGPLAATTFTTAKMAPGADAHAALLVGLAGGQVDAVRAWVGGLSGAERAGAIDLLGNACDKPGVAAFLAAAPADALVSGGWLGGMDTCRAPEVVTVLETALAAPALDTTTRSAVLGTYARNKGPDALPRLEAMLASKLDEAASIAVVEAIGTAAGVGQPGGVPMAVAAKAVAGIVKSAAELPPLAVEAARTTLAALGLGDSEDSDKLALARYRDVKQADDTLRYGVGVVEIGTCKKGEVKIEFHHASFTPTAPAWPDQVAERSAGAREGWRLDLAARCKGTSTLVVLTSNKPLQDQAAYDAWVQAQLSELAFKHAGVKPKVIAEPAIRL
jgi:hypothetical protein